MRLCHATALIGVAIAGCSGPVPPDATPSTEAESIGQPPASGLPLTDTERAIARLQERRQATIEAEMDENLKAQLLAEYTRREEDLRTCESRGDRIETSDQSTWCVEVYSDGGKVCSDSSECEGQCVVEEPLRVEADVQTTGMCQAEEPFGGCFAEITKGVAGFTMCIN